MMQSKFFESASSFFINLILFKSQILASAICGSSWFIVYLYHFDIHVIRAMWMLIFGQWAIHSGRDMAAMMSSVQHVLYYGRHIPSEVIKCLLSKKIICLFLILSISFSN